MSGIDLRLIPEFIQAVSTMRDRQKQYFKTRDKEVLVQSKSAEHEVDSLLRRIAAAQ